MAHVCLYLTGMGEGMKVDFINLNLKILGEVLSPYHQGQKFFKNSESSEKDKPTHVSAFT